MNIWQAVILGLVQGLTEFLPVSSSGHLVLLQRLFGISEGSLFFTVMLHAGSLLAVLIVFRRDIAGLLRRPFGNECKAVIAATFVTGVMYILLDGLVDSAFGGQWLWLGFLYTAALLWYVDKRGNAARSACGRNGGQKDISARAASFIGFMQGVALFPGISRSGSTIAGGLLTGLDRETVSRFSFILSVPAILAGVITELSDITLAAVPWTAVTVGTVCSAAAGYIAIRTMLSVIRKQRLSWFSLYLVVIAAISFSVV